MVALPDAIANPRAVVIVHRYATVTYATVENTWRFYYFACWALFACYLVLITRFLHRRCMHPAPWIRNSNLVALRSFRNAKIVNLLLLELGIVRPWTLLLRLLIDFDIVLPTTITYRAKTRGQTLLNLQWLRWLNIIHINLSLSLRLLLLRCDLILKWCPCLECAHRCRSALEVGRLGAGAPLLIVYRLPLADITYIALPFPSIEKVLRLFLNLLAHDVITSTCLGVTRDGRAGLIGLLLLLVHE